MRILRKPGFTAATAALATVMGLSVLSGLAQAQEKVLNIYSARHYQTDEALYQGFTEETGITINRIEGKEDALIERLKSEGMNSPADLLITVDAGRLWRAEEAGLFQPIESEVLDSRLADSPYLAGDEITIADFANWAWVRTYNWSGVSVEGLDQLKRWVDELYERPGCASGIRKPERPENTNDLVKSAQTMVTR